MNSMTMDKLSIVTCKDGSHTLFSPAYNQHYHNPNGAVQESLHIFFNANGLLGAMEAGQDLSILEIGFGTGLNLMLLADLHHHVQSDSVIDFYSIEARLIDRATAGKLNYGAYLEKPELMNALPDICNALPGMNTFVMAGQVRLHLFNGLFADFHDPSLKADFILHDPFSPGVNAELWTPQTFTKLRTLASARCILSTYSSAAKARDAMTKGGWRPKKVPGTLGKREMTVATNGIISSQ
ncbi:MAG: tRNA (5-methylaminomethyl-2-thiouridine)(34)-methyltransferase MnmD [Balneolales bacterium]